MLCRVCNTKLKRHCDRECYDFCNNCNAVFKVEVVDKNTEQQRYEMHNHEYSNENISYYKMIIENNIIKYISTSDFGLDYGCGQNEVMGRVFKDFFNVQVDSYDVYFNKNGIKNTEYDFITCIEVIEHVQNPIEFLSEMSSYLKEYGYLFIRTCFRPKSLESFFEWYYIRDCTHITFYNKDTFVRLSNMLNFTVIDCNNKDFIVLRKG